MAKIVINGKLPTLNQYIAANNRNRFISAKLKKDATELVAWQCTGMEAITRPADYTFTWYVPNRRSDPDNIAHGMKYCYDGLQAAGKLPNDSMAWVRSITHFFEIGEPKVEIEIDEI